MLQGNVALKIWTKYLEIRNSFSNTFKDFVYTHFIGEKKKRWKVTSFLVVTKIFPQLIILPD